MKKIVSFLAAFVLAIGFAGCGKNSAPEEKVGQLTSLEEMGYTLDLEQIPDLIREDSAIYKDQEVYAFAGICGRFTTVEAYQRDHIGMWGESVAYLQAAPAGSTHLRGVILAIGAVPAERYEEYIIFSNEEIVVYDLYPIFCPSGRPMPERVKQSQTDSWYKYQEDYRAGRVPEDKYNKTPLHIELAACRSLDYVWAYYQENLPNLIVKME